MVSKASEEAREQIGNLYLKGLTPKQISEATGIAYSTVNWHIRKVEASVEWRLNQVAIKEFSLTYDKACGAILQQIQEINIEMASIANPDIKAKMRDQILARWLSLVDLQEDGPAVQALRKWKKEQEQEEAATSGQAQVAAQGT